MPSLRKANRRRRYRAAYDRVWARFIAALARIGVHSVEDLERLP